MAKLRTLLALMVVMAVAPLATAEWVPLPGEPVISLAELQEPYIVGDKVFSDFSFDASATGGAIQPDLSSIFIMKGMDDSEEGTYGVRFLTAFAAGKGQQVRVTMSFKVSILDDPEFKDWYIKDVEGVLADASATGDGIVTMSENIFAGPVPQGDPIASLEFSKQENDGGVSLKDSAEFAPVKEIWVFKDIVISGGSADNGSGHLSSFFQFYSQVPEPATMGLLALGGLVLRRRKR